MSLLIDKLIFLLICATFFLQTQSGELLVVPVVISIFVSALGSLIELKQIRLIIALLFVGSSIFLPEMLLFLPLICLDLFAADYPLAAFACILPVAFHLNDLSATVLLQLTLLIILAWLIYYRSETTAALREKTQVMRDDIQEKSMQMKSKEQSLMERQDYEVNLARMSERNRIAREIHDSLGHQLSRAIIQLGALMTVCREEVVKKQLSSVKDTLSDGMDSIRDSIHDLHDQSILLELEIRKLTDNFNFCPIVLELDIQHEPPLQHRYALIAIVREGLSNVIRHSRATRVSITLREHPGFYQLVLEDNGPQQNAWQGFESNTGIGLKSMQGRVEALDGQIHISQQKGFRIFASLPRKLSE